MRNIDLEVDLVQGDSDPILEFTCLDFDNSPVDLTGAAADLYLKRVNADSHANASTACVVTDAVAGKVQYQIQSGDLDDPGTYFGDLVITLAGKSETSPEAVRLIVRPSNQ